MALNTILFQKKKKNRLWHTKVSNSRFGLEDFFPFFFLGGGVRKLSIEMMKSMVWLYLFLLFFMSLSERKSPNQQ